MSLAAHLHVKKNVPLSSSLITIFFAVCSSAFIFSIVRSRASGPLIKEKYRGREEESRKKKQAKEPTNLYQAKIPC